MIENLDWNFGRVVQTLEDLGELNNTHIFFFADHGDMHGSHGMFRKVNPFEEAIRTPFIITGGRPRVSTGEGRAAARVCRIMSILRLLRWDFAESDQAGVDDRDATSRITGCTSLQPGRSRIRPICKTLCRRGIPIASTPRTAAW